MIAFFDLDGTIITHDSGVLFALPSLRRGLLPARVVARLAAVYALYKLGLRTRHDVQRVGFACYAGRTLAELRATMQELHDDHLRPHISAPVRGRVEAHRRRGERLVILTASASFLAEPMGRELALDDVVGTRVGFAGDGRCTGVVEGDILDGAGKLAAARTYAATHGVELAACSFYSDHHADLPLLDVVGTPVAVGPTRRLARVARERGWPIL